MKSGSKYIIAGLFVLGLSFASQAQAAWPFNGATPPVLNCVTAPNTITANINEPCYLEVYATDPDNDDVKYLLHLGITNIDDFDESQAEIASKGRDYSNGFQNAPNDCVGGVAQGVTFVDSGVHCAQKVTFSSQPQSGQWCYVFGVMDITNALVKTLRCYAITVVGAEDPPLLESLKLLDGSNTKLLAANVCGDTNSDNCVNGAIKVNNKYLQDDTDVNGNNNSCNLNKSAPACRLYPVVKNLPVIYFKISKPSGQSGWLKFLWVYFDQVNQTCAQPWQCVYGYNGTVTKDLLDNGSNAVRVELGNNYDFQTRIFNQPGDPPSRQGDSVTCQRLADSNGKKWWECSYEMVAGATFNHKWFNVRIHAEDNKSSKFIYNYDNWASNPHLKFAIDPINPSNVSAGSP